MPNRQRGGQARFMVIYRGYENPGLPHDEEVALVQLGLEQWKKHKQVKVNLSFVGQRGGITIWEGDSAEELNEAIHSNPLGRLGSWQIEALVTADVELGIMSVDAASQANAQKEIARRRAAATKTR